MIRLFCRPPYSRSVLLGVLPRSGNGATNPTQRSHSILSAPLNQLQTFASLRPLLVVSLCCLSWPPAEALARRRRHSSKRSSGATAPLQWCCNRRGPSSHRRPDFHPLFFLILGILRVRRLWRLVTGGHLGLADVLQLGKACQQATKSQLRVSPAILGRGVQNILENDELVALPGRGRDLVGRFAQVIRYSAAAAEESPLSILRVLREAAASAFKNAHRKGRFKQTAR